jgi:DNA-directed RNA polymerase specialized sigma24 family protein
MGEPEPLDLELLQRGNDDEIRRAIHELDLLLLAQGVVHSVFGKRYPADVRVVALESIKALFTRAIHRCRNVDDIRPNLVTIARWQAINFLNVAFRKWERQFGDEWEQILERPGAHEVNPFEVLGDILAEGLGMDTFQLGPVMNILLNEAELDEVQKHLLIEHILHGCTQREFAERYGIPLQGIGGRVTRLLRKIRRFLAGVFPVGIRATYLQILRRNRWPMLI